MERASRAVRGLQLGRDELAELQENRGRSAAFRLLAQPGDPRALANDLGQHGFLAIVSGHPQLDAVAQLAQQPGELVMARFEEVADERVLVVEDDPEAKRYDGPALEGGCEHLEVPEQVGPARAHLSRRRGAGEGGELPEADRLDRGFGQAGARLRGHVVCGRDAVAVQRSRERRPGRGGLERHVPSRASRAPSGPLSRPRPCPWLLPSSLSSFRRRCPHRHRHRRGAPRGRQPRSASGRAG